MRPAEIHAESARSRRSDLLSSDQQLFVVTSRPTSKRSSVFPAPVHRRLGRFRKGNKLTSVVFSRKTITTTITIELGPSMLSSESANFSRGYAGPHCGPAREIGGRPLADLIPVSHPSPTWKSRAKRKENRTLADAKQAVGTAASTLHPLVTPLAT